MANYNILTEVPPISKQDSFVVFERRKSNFNFPIHIHSEYELNYIIGARGARRIVGDHVADIGDREMVLITGSNLEHAWMDGNLAPGAEIYEVTIQFSPELFQGSGLIDRKQFAPIKKMLQDAQHGIAFSEKTILQSESGIHQLINSTDNFNSILIFLSLLNQHEVGRIDRIRRHVTRIERRNALRLVLVERFAVDERGRLLRQRTGGEQSRREERQYELIEVFHLLRKLSGGFNNAAGC